MAISDSQIEDLKERSDIVALIGQRVKLRKSGKDYQGLCPLHGERTPSFYVVPDKRIFHCFGCGQTGDVFRFFMETEGMNFVEALRFVARESGIILSEEEESPELIRQRQHEEALAALMERAVRYYEKKLWSPSGRGAQQFLQQRGISEKTARQFRLGFGGHASDDLSRALVSAGLPAAHAIEAGLCIEGRRGLFDRFSERLIIPISLPRPPHGRPVALGGRLLKSPPPGRGGVQSAKYINSPETPLYHKGQVLYALDLARTEIRKQERAVVVEGYFDVIALHQAGLASAVATCGTSLSAEHLDLLTRMAAKEVIFLFDGDSAGLRAATRAAELCAQNQVPARVVTLPDKLDPDDFVRQRGLVALEALLDQAKPAIDMLIDHALDSLGTSPSMEQQAQAVRSVRSVVLHAPEGLSRELYVSHIAERLKISESVVRTVILEPGADSTTAPVSRPPTDPRRSPSSQGPRSPNHPEASFAPANRPRETGPRNFSSGREEMRDPAGFRNQPGEASNRPASPFDDDPWIPEGTWIPEDNWEPGQSRESRSSWQSRGGGSRGDKDWGSRSRRKRSDSGRDSRGGQGRGRGDVSWKRDGSRDFGDSGDPLQQDSADAAFGATRSQALEEAVIVALLKFPVLADTVAQQGAVADIQDPYLAELAERIITCRAEGIEVEAQSLLPTLPLSQANSVREKLSEDQANLEDYNTHLGRVLDRLRLERQRSLRQASLKALHQSLSATDPATQSAMAEEHQRLLEESRRIHLRIKEREKP